MKLVLKSALLAVVAVFLTCDLSAQCSMCEAVLNSSATDNRQSLGAGINSGILYLMGAVYLTLFLVFRKRIRAFWLEFKALWN